MATFEEYRLMALDSYGNNKGFPDLQNDDWAREAIPGSNASNYYTALSNDGFNASTYFKTVNNKITDVVITYRGTDDPADIATDAGIAFNLGTPQLNDAKTYYESVIDYLLNQNIDPATVNISFTGHSLGGGLAQYMAAITGLSATTFNAVGMANLVKPLMSDYNTRSFNINNYIVNGDFVSTTFDEVGVNHYATIPIDPLQTDDPQFNANTPWGLSLLDHMVGIDPNLIEPGAQDQFGVPITLTAGEFNSYTPNSTSTQLYNARVALYATINAGLTALSNGLLNNILPVTNTSFVQGNTDSNLITPNVFEGSSLNDLLIGTSGNDTFMSGTGNDTIYSGTGNDEFVFGVGDGNDAIFAGSSDSTQPVGTDTIAYGNGINPTNLRLGTNGNDLTVSFQGTNIGSLTLKNQLNANGSGAYNYQVSFADDPNDPFYIGNGNNNTTTTVTTANTGYFSDGGNDTLEAKGGNDTLFDEIGNDTFVFNRGDGAETIDNNGGGNDALEFGAGISSADLQFSVVNGTDLQIGIKGTSDAITIQNQLNPADIGAHIGHIEFQPPNTAQTVYGSAGNNLYVGNGESVSYLGNNNPNGIDTIMADGLVSSTSDPNASLTGVNDYIVEDAQSLFLMGDGEVQNTSAAGGGQNTLTGGDDLIQVSEDSGNNSDFIIGDGVINTNSSSTSQLIGGNDDIQISLSSGQSNTFIVGDGFETLSGGQASLKGGDDIIQASGNIANSQSHCIILGDGGLTLSDPAQASFIGGNDYIDVSKVQATGQVMIEGDGTITDAFNGASSDQYQGGNDTILGPSGGGEIIGDGGFSGMSSSPIVNGGNDYIVGGSGNNLLIGDFIINSSTGGAIDLTGGNNTLIAGSGNDILFGASMTHLFNLAYITDAPSVFANSNYSSLFSSPPPVFSSNTGGHNLLVGGSGNDVYVFDDHWGQDTLELGSGTSTLDFSAVTGGVTESTDANGQHTITDGVDTVVWSGSANILTSSGGSAISAGPGTVTLTSGAGNDTLTGGTGNTTFQFYNGWGQDSLISGSGTNTLDMSNTDTNLTINLDPQVTDGNGNTIQWQPGAIQNVLGGSGNDTITGDSQNNVINGGPGNDSLSGGGGNDTYAFSDGWGQDTVTAGTGNNVLDLSAVTSDLTVDPTNTTISDANGDTINWQGTIQKIIGGTGGDTYLYTAGSGSETIQDGGGNDTLALGAGIQLSNLTFIQSGNDLVIDQGSDAITLTNQLDASQPNDKIETLRFSDGSTMDYTQFDALAKPPVNIIQGTSGDDLLMDTSGDDHIFGYAGNDTLISSGGHDTLEGGAGNDIYRFTPIWQSAQLVDNAGEANILDLTAITAPLNIDLVNQQVTDTAGQSIQWSGNILQTVLGGSGADTITGSSGGESLSGGAGNDSITGGSGNDTLDGGTGADTMAGGQGDDLYIVDNPGDLVIENANAGIDTVQSSISYILPANVENLTLTGSANLSGTGNALNNVITGNSGNDTLNGGGGQDTLIGGNGNNTFQFGNAWGQDTITAGTGQSTIDLSQTHADLTLNLYAASGPQITDSAGDSIQWTPGVLPNIIAGSGNETFIFSNGWGQETITAGSGNNTVDLSAVTANLAVNLTVASGPQVSDGHGNTIQWQPGSIQNIIGGSGSDLITGDGHNNLLEGGSGNDTLQEASGNNTLDGGLGNDSLIGGTGNDTYRFENNWGQDTISDSGGSNTADLSAVTSNLTVNFNVASKQITDGTDTVTWTGNPIQTLLSGSGNDSITAGNSGGEFLNGGAGNDTYSFNNNWGQDTISDSSGENQANFSVITSALTINLANASNQAVSGTNIVTWNSNAIQDVTGGSGNDLIAGNSQNNILNGGSGNNTLDGGGGNDTLIAGAGNDAYRFENNWGHDSISDAGGSNTADLSAVTSNLTINLSAASNQMTDGTDTATWTGNPIQTVLTGSGNDGITAGNGGNELLEGGAGNDTYSFNNNWGLDTISDSLGENQINFSNVTGSITVNLGSTSGQAISASSVLTWSSSAIQDVVGGSGSDILNGDSANNLLIGGSGDDILSGNGGNDTFDGGLGNDILSGGSGNDVYRFENNWGQDTISDAGGSNTADFSAVTSNLTINLSAFFNQMTDSTDTVLLSGSMATVLGGSGNDTITGSSGNQFLSGGAGSDSLTAGSGNDTLNGGTGNDTLAGGSGNNTDTFDLNDGQDLILQHNTFGHSGTVHFNGTIAQSRIAFFMNGSNLQIGYTGDSSVLITVQSQNTSSGQIQRFESSTGQFLSNTDINTIIQSMSSYATSHGVSFTSLSDVKNNAGLMNIINTAWHS